MANNMGKIIKDLRTQRGLTQDELAKIVGVQRSAIAKYELGIVDNMKRTTIEIMANFFNVSPTYLMGLDEEEQPNNVLKDLLIIPVVGKITAGAPILAVENIEDNLIISSSMYNLSSPDGLFFLRVIGDSMNKIIPNGGFALMRQEDTAENGDVVAAIVNGDNEVTLKKFKQIDNNFVMLEPESTFEEYQPMIINLKETEFKIVGKLIGIFKKW